MRTLIYFLAALVYMTTHAQQITKPSVFCDDKVGTTDPQSPVDLRGQPYLNQDPTTLMPKFDWTEDLQYPWFKPGFPNPFLINSPFRPSNYNDENISHFMQQDVTLRDNLIEDGWEMMYYEFGKYYDGTQSPGPDHPKLILYNKHTGTLRIFIYLRETNLLKPSDVASIKFRFDQSPSNVYESANLNHFEEAPFPLDQYNKYQIEESANDVAGATSTTQVSGQWMYADFTMAYDPCVCNFRYKRFEILVTILHEADMNLTGDINTNTIDRPATGSGTSYPGTDFKSNYKEFSNAKKGVKAAYKEASGFKDFVLSKSKYSLPEKRQEVITNTNWSMYKTLNTFSTVVPYLGAAVGVVNYLSTANDPPQKPKPQAITFNATVNLSGTLTDWTELDPTYMHVPGSKYPTNNPQHIPLYDEPMGIFSLLKTPTIEYQHHWPATLDGNGNLVRHPRWQSLPFATTFTVKDDLEIALNPSSELEIVEVKVSNVLEYAPYGKTKYFQNRLDLPDPTSGSNFFNYPYVPGIDFSHAYSNFSNTIKLGGYFDRHWSAVENTTTNLELQRPNELYKISFGQMPLGCYKDSRFTLLSNIHNPNDGDWIWEKPKILVRLNVTLRHPVTGRIYKKIQSYLIDQDNIVDSEQPVQLFLIETEPFPTSEASHDFLFQLLPQVGNPTNLYFSQGSVPDYLVYEDQIIGPGVIEAWEDIYIGNNVIIQPGTEIIAGNQIEITPENLFNPEVRMRIGRSSNTTQCSSTPISNYIITNTNLGTFCDYYTGDSYNPLAPSMNKREVEQEENLPDKLVNFNLYPNPTDNLVNVEVEWKEDESYTIAILDVSGRAMYTTTLASDEFIGGTATINTSSLESGIYFVNVIQGTRKMTKRLLITR